MLQKLLDAWYPLWTLVFQPALGVLMLGAVCYLWSGQALPIAHTAGVVFNVAMHASMLQQQ